MDNAMAGHDGDDFDPARLARMERRLQSLEDAEGIAALFTEDATWDSPGLPVLGSGFD
ncbi:MAG TPA: hypothetical protein VGH29_05200 [Candidatus Binataceae bacterium]